MTQAIGSSIPWADGEDRSQAKNTKTAETTGKGNRSTPWVVVGVNLNPGEAVVIKGRLESEDIPVVVQQEALGSFLGLTVGVLGAARVLVPEPLAEKALQILAQTFEWDEEAEDSFAGDAGDADSEDEFYP